MQILKRLEDGLQNRLGQFDSDSALHTWNMEKLVDSLDCGSSVERRAGSSPVIPPICTLSSTVLRARLISAYTKFNSLRVYHNAEVPKLGYKGTHC